MSAFTLTEFAKFLLVGGFAAFVNAMVRIGLSTFMILEVAVTIAYLVGMTVAYLLSRKFVFEKTGRKVEGELLRFSIVNGTALVLVLGITVFLARLLFPYIGFFWYPETIAHLIAVLSPAVTSYFGHKYFTFGRKVDQ